MENNEVIVKKSNKGVIIVLIIVIIVLCSYIIYDKFITKNINTTNDTTSIKKENINSNNQSTQSNLENIYEFNWILNNDSIRHYFQVEFDDVSKIDMNKVIMYNFDVCSSENKKGDTNYYMNILGIKNEEELNGSINICTKEKLAQNFKNITGKDISILSNDLLPKYYSSLDDAYLFNVSDYDDHSLYVYSVTENNDDTYLIKYIDDQYGSSHGIDHKEVVLKKSDTPINGMYQIISNKIIRK